MFINAVPDMNEAAAKVLLNSVSFYKVFDLVMS